LSNPGSERGGALTYGCAVQTQGRTQDQWWDTEACGGRSYINIVDLLWYIAPSLGLEIRCSISTLGKLRWSSSELRVKSCLPVWLLDVVTSGMSADSGVDESRPGGKTGARQVVASKCYHAGGGLFRPSATPQYNMLLLCYCTSSRSNSPLVFGLAAGTFLSGQPV
jgi:hypothetical protein